MTAQETSTAGYLRRAGIALAAIDAAALRRRPRRELPAGAVDFSSNDYLGFARHPRVIAALAGAHRVGSGGSRLLGGAHPEYRALEEALAVWTGRERALLFSSGYLAALGAIVTLAPLFDRASSDRLLHACGIDALRLTRIPRTIYPHGGEPVPGDGSLLVVTESLFGMTGTRIDLARVLRALDPDDALVVDEAHALGIAGTGGGGACVDLRDPRIVVLGTLSKAVGAVGGFVAGPACIIELLETSARTFLFDTALPPAVATAAHIALDLIRGPEGDAARANLTTNVAMFVDALSARAIVVPQRAGPMLAIPLGDAARAVRVASELEARGFFAPAIRPPTVPAGASQLRVTVRADHTPRDLSRFADALGDVLARVRVVPGSRP